MIINIRGTHGSGKSTIVKKVMEAYGGTRTSYKEKGRRRPIGYVFKDGNGKRPLAIVGHYEIACGGADTITKMDRPFELAREAEAQGFDVIFEGALASLDFKRTVQMYHDGLPLTVIGLDTDFDLCIESINKRRWAKDPNKPPINPKNAMNKFKTTKNTMRKLQEAGATAVWKSRQEAFELICELLELE